MIFTIIRARFRRWRIKKRFGEIHNKYYRKLRAVEKKGEADIEFLWKQHQVRQIDDYIACIDHRLHFISRLISRKTLLEIRQHKERYRRRKDFRKVLTLTNILFQSDIDKLEMDFIEHTTIRKRTWLLWK